MKLNRELQREILFTLTERFPDVLPNPNHWYQNHAKNEVDGNLLYLQMHGLIEFESKKSSYSVSNDYTFFKITPTEKAFDFLADDGGLSAVLGVVTVKFHADTLKELIAAKINTADNLSETQKNTLLNHVSQLPSEALKHLTTKLLDAAFDNLPAAYALLEKFFFR